MSYTYDKALSLDWNGKIMVLSNRNEIPRGIGGNNYTYSYNGNSWSSGNINISNSMSVANPYNVKWTGSNYEILGNIATSSTNTMVKSKDGLAFAPIAADLNTNTLYDLEVNIEKPNTITFPRNTTLALGGVSADSTKIAYSLDSGTTWTPSGNSNAVFTTSANAACWNGKIWVAVGQGGNTIATSPDGNVWTGRGSFIFTTAAYGISWAKELALWVAVGQGKNTHAYSYDGVYWTGLGAPAFTRGNDVQWSGQIFVSAGVPISGNASIAYSVNGQSWSIPSQTNLFDGSGIKVGWNGNFWTAIGYSSLANGSTNIATSIDGKTWFPTYNSNMPASISNLYVGTRTNVGIYNYNIPILIGPTTTDATLLYFFRFNTADTSGNTTYNSGFGKNIYDASAQVLNISNTIYKYGTGSYYLQTMGASQTNNIYIRNGFTGLTAAAFSIAFWWYPTSAAQAGNNMFFYIGGAGGSNQLIFFWNFNGTLSAGTVSNIFLYGSTNAGANVAISPTTNGQGPFTALNTWYHLAFCVSGSSPTWTTYINGQLRYTTNASSQTWTFNASRPIFSIGSNGSGDTVGSVGTYFDDFRIYNKVLTAQNVSDICNNLI
jgi:hypothetical protein